VTKNVKNFAKFLGTKLRPSDSAVDIRYSSCAHALVSRVGATPRFAYTRKDVLTIHICLRPCLVPDSPLNSTMQKEDSPSHQNVGKCMEY
jgi:hypothetical protein